LWGGVGILAAVAIVGASLLTPLFRKPLKTSFLRIGITLPSDSATVFAPCKNLAQKDEAPPPTNDQPSTQKLPSRNVILPSPRAAEPNRVLPCVADAVIRRVSQLPRITRAAMLANTLNLTFAGVDHRSERFNSAKMDEDQVQLAIVTPEYFRAINSPPTSGR